MIVRRHASQFLAVLMLLPSQLSPVLALRCGANVPTIAGAEPPSVRGGTPRILPDTTLVFIGQLASAEPVGPRPQRWLTTSQTPRYFIAKFAIDRQLRAPEKAMLRVLVVRPALWPYLPFSNNEAQESIRHLAARGRDNGPWVHVLPAPNDLSSEERAVAAGRSIDAVLRFADCANHSYRADEPIGRYLISALTAPGAVP